MQEHCSWSPVNVLQLLPPYDRARLCVVNSSVELYLCMYVLMKTLRSSAVRKSSTGRQSATASCWAAASVRTPAACWRGWLLSAANWHNTSRIRPSTSASKYARSLSHLRRSSPVAEKLAWKMCNNSNNNNNFKTMFMVLSWQSHCESSPGSSDECRTAPSGRWLKTKPDDLSCESACTGCQSLHPPSPFIIISQLESWYSFYRPTEGSRLSRPSWLVTYRDGLPVHRRSPILVLTGSGVAQLRWSRPTRYH